MLSDAAEGALVESLASVVQSLDRVDDENLDEYLAINLLEYVCYRLGELSRPDRHAVAALCRARMAQASEPWMREALEALLRGCRLNFDEDHEAED